MEPHPGASSEAVSRRMSIARRKDTKPELDLRQVLHSRGMRYRVVYPVPGRPRRSIDVAFTRVKVAVFVDGCFWHMCPDHRAQPRTNSDWWKVKFARNVARDRETDQHLTSLGWTVLRFWEHEDMATAARAVEQVVHRA
ncbi:very short patch repair endonuclease [Promicromonospora alba]|uniref:Very short patch repair endonuclease n=1 Tax=Promicromonospora alba TaxID=1616110 RepID=A0ABV9HRD6_9MICO